MGGIYRSYSGVSGDDGQVITKVPVDVLLALPRSAGSGFYDNFVGAGCPTDSSAATSVAGWVDDYVANAGTIVPAAVEGGGIVLTPDTAENDGMQIQKQPSMVLDTDTRCVFGAKVTLADVLAQDVFIGLATADADLAQSKPNDHVGFYVADGAGTIFYSISDGGTATAATTGSTAVNATSIWLECFMDGEKSVEFYIDGDLVIDAAVTNLPEDTVMGFGIATVNGDSSSNTLTVSAAYAYNW